MKQCMDGQNMMNQSNSNQKSGDIYIYIYILFTHKLYQMNSNDADYVQVGAAPACVFADVAGLRRRWFSPASRKNLSRVTDHSCSMARLRVSSGQADQTTANGSLRLCSISVLAKGNLQDRLISSNTSPPLRFSTNSQHATARKSSKHQLHLTYIQNIHRSTLGTLRLWLVLLGRPWPLATARAGAGSQPQAEQGPWFV